MEVVVADIAVDSLGYVTCYHNWFEKLEATF